jgi:hypothetical protein
MTVPLIRTPGDTCVHCGEEILLQGVWRHVSSLTSACENGRTNAQPANGTTHGGPGLAGDDQAGGDHVPPPDYAAQHRSDVREAAAEYALQMAIVAHVEQYPDSTWGELLEALAAVTYRYAQHLRKHDDTTVLIPPPTGPAPAEPLEAGPPREVDVSWVTTPGWAPDGKR